MCSSSGTVLEMHFFCIIPYYCVSAVGVWKVLVIFASHWRIPCSWCSSQTLFASLASLWIKFKMEEVFWNSYLIQEDFPEHFSHLQKPKIVSFPSSFVVSYNFFLKMQFVPRHYVIILYMFGLIQRVWGCSILRLAFNSLCLPTRMISKLYKNVRMQSLFIVVFYKPQ